MLPVTVQRPVDGSYNPALAPHPPVTNTFPLASTDAVCPYRALLRLPVVVQLLVDGSYNSALLRSDKIFVPAATNTLPSANTDAV